MFWKELTRLVEIGILTTVQQYEYGTPVFIIEKKEGTIRLLTNLHWFNKTIFQKPDPIPMIGDTMQ